MHVLVTGGSGFIGRALCAELLARGHGVSVLTRSAPHAAGRLPPAVRCVETLEALGDDPPQGIVNLAGENLSSGRWNAERKRRFVDSRVQVTRRLIAWIETLRARPQVLVSGSAIGWYGARGDEALTEASPAGAPGEFASELCRIWEAEAQRAETLGVRVCRLRTGIVLERDGGSLAQMLLPFRLGLGGPIGSGRQWVSWVHRADHVALTIRLLETPSASGAYNATAPMPVTNAELARTLGRVLHRPALLRMPGPVLKLLLGEMADIVLTGQRVLPARAQEEGFAFRYPELEAALRAILG